MESAEKNPCNSGLRHHHGFAEVYESVPLDMTFEKKVSCPRGPTKPEGTNVF